MKPSRVWIPVTLAVYVAWLGWLAVAVYGARWNPDRTPVVSRAQLTGATHLLVCDVTAGPDGLPQVTATVAEVVRGDGAKAGDAVEVWNLPSALPAGADAMPAGRYLLPLVGGGGGYKVAGLPRSPGYEPAQGARPVVYRWTPGMETQLRALGVRPLASNLKRPLCVHSDGRPAKSLLKGVGAPHKFKRSSEAAPPPA